MAIGFGYKGGRFGVQSIADLIEFAHPARANEFQQVKWMLF